MKSKISLDILIDNPIQFEWMNVGVSKEGGGLVCWNFLIKQTHAPFWLFVPIWCLKRQIFSVIATLSVEFKRVQTVLPTVVDFFVKNKFCIFSSKMGCIFFSNPNHAKNHWTCSKILYICYLCWKLSWKHWKSNHIHM